MYEYYGKKSHRLAQVDSPNPKYHLLAYMSATRNVTVMLK